jgi:hypothetical protein
MSATTTAAGADASIAIRARASSNGTFSDAGIYLDAMTGGTSRIRLDASDVIVDGVYLASGGIVTGFIAANAVTKQPSSFTAGTQNLGGSNADFTLATTSYTTASGNPVDLFFDADVRNSAGSNTIEFALVIDGSTVNSWIVPVTSFFQKLSDLINTKSTIFQASGSHTYALHASDASLSSTAECKNRGIAVKDWVR